MKIDRTKKWKEIDDLCECNVCDHDNIEIFTDSEFDGQGIDGDELRCKNCGAKSSVFVTDDDEDGNNGILNANEFESALSLLEKNEQRHKEIISGLKVLLAQIRYDRFGEYGESDRYYNAKDIESIIKKYDSPQNNNNE